MTDGPIRSRQTAPYDFVPGQPAIVTEIYLPHKYALSPEFLQALENSLRPNKVQCHFETIIEDEVTFFLPYQLRPQYDQLRNGVVQSRRVFDGYSVYNVAGAFRNTKTSDPSKAIMYDANACVRIIDSPTNVALFPDQTSRPNEDLFQRVVRTVFGWRRHHENRQPPLPLMSNADDLSMSAADSTVAAAIRKRLDLWIDEGSFLLYGFVGYHLGQVTKGEEEVILLTSHFAVANVYGRRETEKSSKERPMFFSIECAPAPPVIVKKGKQITLTIILKNASTAQIVKDPPPGTAVWESEYDESVVKVTPPKSGRQVQTGGLIKFGISGESVGGTVVTFSAGGARCMCTILVELAQKRAKPTKGSKRS